MAKKKEKAPQLQVNEIAESIKETIKSWKDHKKNGCNDPGWADGVNMNLLRNHVFSYKRRIRELCAEYGLPLPSEAYTPDLPYVDNNFFAKPESDRAKRIMNRPGWECCNHEPPSLEYDEEQLSLF